MVNKLPANWKLKTLSEVGNIILGGTPDTTKKEYWNGNILWVIPSEVTSLPSKYLYDTERKITELGLKNSSAKIIKPNSLIICTRATIGNCCINKNEVATNQGFKSIIPNEDYDVVFLYYIIINNKQKLISKASGTTFLEISKTNLANLSFYFPPLDEQKRIASALSKIDAYLENTIKLIEEKERFKRGIAKKLLTCKEGENIPEARFKGFNDDWRKEKLSSMIKIQGCYAFKSSEFKKSGIPIIRISNISNTDNNMNINMKEIIYYNEIENEKSFIIKKSDLLIALSGAPGKSSIYNLEEKAYLNQRVGLFKIIDTKKINNSFLSQYVFSSIFQNKLKPFITRGVQPNISPKDIENLDILLPSLKEQEKIGGYLSLLDAEIDNLKKQKELIKEMKRGAMQKLLSGEVRLLE